MRRVLVFAFLAAVFATGARASGFLLFQHGGKAMAEVGAFTARATDAAAVYYNPAAVARLEGTHYQVGLEFTAPQESYGSASGGFEGNHLITETPVVYATWHLPSNYYPLAFGVGIENDSWYLVDWGPLLFPGRFLTRRERLTLWSVHPVVAYQLGDTWSVGGGLRYYRGYLEEGNNGVVEVAGSERPASVESERLAESTVDGYSFDLGLQAAGEAWGWGLVLDSGGKLDGSGRVHYSPRDLPEDPVVRSNLAALLAGGRSRLSFDLPWQARTGFVLGGTPGVRYEADLQWTAWSKVRQTSVHYAPDPFLGTSGATEVRPRRWKDTLSARLGVEGDAGEHWLLAGGVGWEPTPVPASTLEPGFPRGDAIVYGVGFGYHIRNIGLDIGYSYFAFARRHATAQELEHPTLPGAYDGHDQVWGFSASWHH